MFRNALCFCCTCGSNLIADGHKEDDWAADSLKWDGWQSQTQSVAKRISRELKVEVRRFVGCILCSLLLVVLAG